MKNLVKNFMTSALLGFTALLASGTALAGNKPPKLHASADALRAMGKEYRDELLQWAGRDVLLLTDKDFAAIQAKAERKNPEINFLDIDFSSALQKQFRRFPVGTLSTNTILAIAHKSTEPSPFALGFKTGDATENTHCVIVLKSEPLNVQKFSAQFASQSEHIIENVSITPKELLTFVLAHEAQHCDDDRFSFLNIPLQEIIKQKVESEADSDQFAIYALSQRDKKGNTLISESSIEELINLRSVGSFTGSEIQYSIAGSLDKKPTDNHDRFNTQRTQEMLEAHSFIWSTILSRVSDVGKNAIPQLQFIQYSFKYINDREANMQSPILGDINPVVTDWILHPPQKNNIDTILKVNSTLQKALSDLSQHSRPYERQIALLAPLKASSYLSLRETYGLVHMLNKEGAFKSNPLAQKEVDLFIRAAEKHFPSQAVQLRPAPNAPGS